MKFHIERYSGIDLADQIYDAIISEITVGNIRAGEKLPTMQEIAKATGVTFRTARGVVERLAREGHVVSRPGVGTVVAPKNITVWKGRVLFVIREEDEASYHVNMVMGELRRRCLSAGYLFGGIVASRREGGDFSLLQAMQDYSLSFVVVMYDSPKVEAMLDEANVPYVVVCSNGESRKNAWRIPFSPCEAIAAFVDHCCRKGVKRVVQVDIEGNSINFEAMDKPLAEAGIEFEHVSVKPQTKHGRYAGIEIGAQEAFLAYPRERYPDVFLVWDAFVARGIFLAMLRKGVAVPRDVAVVVQSNRGLGPVFTCPITRFEADGAAVGASVAEFVLTILQKKRVPKVPMLTSEYIIGGTFSF